MRTASISLFFFFILVTGQFVRSQSISDCNGAIVLCGDDYSSEFSPTGTGSIYEYTGPCNNNLETQSTWYTFSVQAPGILNFVLTPNDLDDDYDWALFDITTGGCAGISANGSSPTVSCNSYGTLLGPNGATGISTTLGGVSNNGGPGDLNGPPFNADLPVVAGSSFALVVMNWSNSLVGYNISFSGSTATIYDAVSPVTATVNAGCDNDQLVVYFSEPIVTTSVQAGDFVVTDGNTTVSVSGVSVPGNGSTSEVFVLQLESVINPGTYTLDITDTNGFVEDVCGNLAFEGIIFNIPDPISFTFSTTPSCNGNSGSMEITQIDGGVEPYSLSFNDVIESDFTVDNLLPGIYTAEIIDNRNCSVSEEVIIASADVLVSIPTQDTLSCNTQAIEVTGIVVDPETGLTFLWQYLTPEGFENTGDSTLNPTFDTPGIYQLIAIDTLSGCSGGDIMGIATTTEVYDIVSPVPVSINTDCNQQEFQVVFSEPVIINSVQAEDMVLSVNGNEIAIASIQINPNSTNASDTLYFTLNSAVAEAGMGTLVFTENANFITDACQNPVLQSINIELFDPINFEVSTQPACNENDGQLTIENVNGGNGNYTILVDSVLTNEWDISNLTVGTYNVTIADSLNCFSSQTVNVVDGSFEIILPEQDLLSCFQPDIELTGIVPLPIQTVVYSWSLLINDTWQNLNTQDPTPVINTPGTYLIVMSNTATGCSAEAEFEIGNTEPWNDTTSPTFVSAEAPECAGGSIIVTLSEPVLVATVDPEDFQLVVESGVLIPSAVVPLMDNVPEFDAFELFWNSSPDGGGPNTVQAINSQNPITDACGNILLGGIDLILPSTIIFSPSITTACNGTGGSIAIEEINGGSPPYALSIDGIAESDFQANDLSNGTHTIVIADALGCNQNTNLNVPNYIISVFVPEQDSLSCDQPSIGIDNIEVTATGDISYTWEVLDEDVFVDAGLNGAAPSVNTPGVYQVTIQNDQSGCSASSIFTVTTEVRNNIDLDNMRFPNIFTPNKDGRNESWAPFVAEDPELDITGQFEEYQLKIFNRWGKKVYDSEDSNSRRWTVNEEETGTYFFMLRYKRICGGLVEGEKEGTIQLLR